MWVAHRPKQNLQTLQAVAPCPMWKPQSENVNVESNLDRGLRPQPEAKKSVISDGRWLTSLRPTDLGQRPQAPESDPKMTVTAPEPGVSDMGVDPKHCMVT